MSLQFSEFESVLRWHQAHIYRYVRYLGAMDCALAEDLTQETFLAAFRSSTPFPADEREQSAWLRGIARNLFLAHCRQARNNPVHIDSQAVEQAEVLWREEFLREGDGFDYVEALRECMKSAVRP